MRYSTCENWAKWFEENEGVNICAETIRHRMRDFLAGQKMARNFKNKMIQIFSETDVREACKDLIEKRSQQSNPKAA